MPSGTVKWFNTTKGYGFIAPDDGGNDVFVHISAVKAAGLNPLKPGDKIIFDVDIAAKGPMAVNLQKPDILPHEQQ